MFIPNEYNLGGRKLIVQTQYNHIQNLKQVKPTLKLSNFISTSSTKLNKSKPNMTKKEKYQLHQHRRNLINLNNKLNSVSSWNNRIKNKTDYIAHPVLFFREVKSSQKKNLKRFSRNQETSNRNLGKKKEEMNYVLSQEDLIKELPELGRFESEDLRQYANSIIKIIVKFMLDNKEKLNDLYTKIIRSIPKHYPNNFEDIVKQIFVEIQKKLFE